MKHVCSAVAFFLLCGCNTLTSPSSSMPFSAPPLLVWSAGEAVSYLSSGKLMEDHFASFVTEKDCSLFRYFSRQGKFCMTALELQEANKPKWATQKVYCYKTIAQPVCYAEPSPFPSDTLIGIYERPLF